jgi:hypothetical protein
MDQQRAHAVRTSKDAIWNRDPLETMAQVGFVVDGVYSFKTFETMLPAFPMIRVEAHNPARTA